MNESDTTYGATDAPSRFRGQGLPILAKTCGKCLASRPTTGGGTRKLPQLIKPTFVCAACLETMA